MTDTIIAPDPRQEFPELGYWYWARPPLPEAVYDGDTIKELVVETGFGQTITIELRFYGVNTPERWPLKTRTAALVSRARVLKFINKRFRVQTFPDKRPNVQRKGKFGRWLGVVWAQTYVAHGVPCEHGVENGPDCPECGNEWLNLNRLLVHEGLGVSAFYGDEELW